MVSLQKATRLPRPPLIPAVAVGLWLCAVVAVWLIVAPGREVATLCHIRAGFDVVCPTCGGTRAAFSLLHGDVFGALLFNPLVTVTLIVAAFWMMFRLGTGYQIRLRLDRTGWKVATLLLIVLVATNWIYLLATHPAN